MKPGKDNKPEDWVNLILNELQNLQRLRTWDDPHSKVLPCQTLSEAIYSRLSVAFSKQNQWQHLISAWLQVGEKTYLSKPEWHAQRGANAHNDFARASRPQAPLHDASSTHLL